MNIAHSPPSGIRTPLRRGAVRENDQVPPHVRGVLGDRAEELVQARARHHEAPLHLGLALDAEAEVHLGDGERGRDIAGAAAVWWLIASNARTTTMAIAIVTIRALNSGSRSGFVCVAIRSSFWIRPEEDRACRSVRAAAIRPWPNG